MKQNKTKQKNLKLDENVKQVFGTGFAQVPNFFLVNKQSLQNK